MAKVRLNTKQNRNIRARQQKLMDRAGRKHSQTQEIQEEPNTSALGPVEHGTVISRYGKQVDIEKDSDHSIYRCFIRRTIASITTGDKVLFRIDEQHNDGTGGLVETVLPRSSLLSRPDYYDGLKPIAANLSKIIIVSAKLPEFSTNILDRYLVACEIAGITPVIVVNKLDLFTPEERGELKKLLTVYESLGYQTLCVSTKPEALTDTENQLKALKALLQHEHSVLVGQSGVGKSSLLNAITPVAEAQTGAVSSTSGLGQHTTTSTKLYHLSDDGIIVDSPGVREFSLWHLTDDEVTKSYREFRPYLGHCKFSDCKHLKDPGCAITEALEEGKIAAFRYENYHRIITSMKENKPDAYVKPGRKYGK